MSCLNLMDLRLIKQLYTKCKNKFTLRYAISTIHRLKFYKLENKGSIN